MNPSELFISRPITTFLMTAGLVVFGAMSYRLLPVSDLPNVDFPTIQVSASLPGASPATMASAVALPLEKQFSTIAGVTSINSTSALGSTGITLQFDLSRDIDAAAQDVQAMIAKATRLLPPQMPLPPSYNKVNPADQPLMFLVLRSPGSTFPLSAIDEYAETMVAPRISTVKGVAQVTVYGSQKYAVRIELDPRQLAAHAIGIDEVATAIQNANANVPTGILYGQKTFVVQANGQLLKASAYQPIVIAHRNGSPVRLDQVARVRDGVENDQTAAWYEHQRTVFLFPQKQPGSNVVAVVDGIKQLLPSIRATLPPGVTFDVRTDQSVQIRNSVEDVTFTLKLAICLVVLVIFVFLRNLSATVIPSLALPVSIVATFAVMYLLNYSLNNLSLMALTLCVGFVVDDAIVMLENIVRHMEMGKGRLQAALDGSKEIVFTIVSMTLSLAAVFIPVLFMGGIIGRLLREFAVTIGTAILVSGFVSISLTPMLCSRFLRAPRTLKHGRLYNASERVFDAALRVYGWSLSQSLRFRAGVMGLSVLLAIGTFYLFAIIPKGFLPTADTDVIRINTEAIQGISYSEMVSKQLALEPILESDPNIVGFSNNVASAGTSINTGRIYVDLKPRAERTLSADQVIAELRPKLSQIPGLRVFIVNPPTINIGGQQTRALYQFTLQGTDTEELYHWAPIFEASIRKMPGFEDVNSDLLIKNPQINVDLDRNKISALGLTVNQVETALYNAYGARQVSTIYAPNNQYQVIMEVGREFQRNPAALSMLYVRSSTGKLVPLDTVAKVTTSVGPLSVNHAGQLPSVTISFNLKPGIALGDAVAAVQAAAIRELPGTITTSFQGVAQAFQQSLQGLSLVLVMAIVVIYIVLGILYESLTQPLTILSGLAPAGFGALLTLMIFKTELSLYAFVGIIMLIGLVKKNGIMMVDFAVAAQREYGKTPIEAIHEACLVRFRPIMMTTMAALVGTLPIALGWGAGAETRRPLGLAVVGGLVVSQFLTLYITPVYFVYLESARLWLTGPGRAATPVDAPYAAAAAEMARAPRAIDK